MTKKYFNPYTLNEPIFQKGFEIAELAHLTPRQYEAYLKSLMEYSEVKNVSDTSFGEGMAKGELAKAIKIAQNMLLKGFDLKTISELTGLTAAEIENLTNQVG